MKHLYVLMSWPEDMDMLWIKCLSFVSDFSSSNFSCSMIVHIDQKWRGHKFSEFAGLFSLSHIVSGPVWYLIVSIPRIFAFFLLFSISAFFVNLMTNNRRKQRQDTIFLPFENFIKYYLCLEPIDY